MQSKNIYCGLSRVGKGIDPDIAVQGLNCYQFIQVKTFAVGNLTGDKADYVPQSLNGIFPPVIKITFASGISVRDARPLIGHMY